MDAGGAGSRGWDSRAEDWLGVEVHAMDTVTINRAPVLTLWAAVVAEQRGVERDEALTLGKAVAGLTAQSKGQRLG